MQVDRSFFERQASEGIGYWRLRVQLLVFNRGHRVSAWIHCSWWRADCLSSYITN